MAELLAKSPLYRKLKFKNESVHDYPEIVRVYCPICLGERNFDQFLWEGIKSTRRVQGPFGPVEAVTARRALRTLHYRCPDCKKYSISYFVKWEQTSEGQVNVISKCGQYPEIQTIIDPALEKSIPTEDAALLKMAIRARDFNFGLASVAYLRRVVENQIEPLIDQLLQDQEGKTEKIRAEIEEARKDRGFRRLLDLAGRDLPEYLKPNGQNPLVHLHRLASEGVHNLPEEECIEVFDESILVFSFLFRELHRHQDEVQKYAHGLEKLRTKNHQPRTK